MDATYDELMQLQEITDKLETLLEDNNLCFRFDRGGYPIRLVVTQNTGVSEQMEIYRNTTDAVSSRDARLEFIFAHADIIVRTDSRLVIPDALLSKIKGYAKKMNYLYLQAFFREEMERRGRQGEEAEE